MAVSEDDVRHVANLARLGLDPARIPRFVYELNGILGHMEILRSVNTEHVEPMAGPPGESRLTRPDEPSADPLLRSREDMAPAWREGFFLVPRLAAHEDAGS